MKNGKKLKLKLPNYMCAPKLSLNTHIQTHTNIYTVPLSLFCLLPSGFSILILYWSSEISLWNPSWVRQNGISLQPLCEQLQFSLQAPLCYCNAVKGVRAQLFCYNRMKCRQRGGYTGERIPKESYLLNGILLHLLVCSCLSFHSLIYDNLV